MRARGLRIASMSTALIILSDAALAQSEGTGDHVLPTLRARMPTQHAKRPKPKIVAAPAVSPAPTPAPPPATAELYPTSPLGGGISPDKVPASLNVVGPADIQRAGSANITDALRQSVPSINITEVAGNPFQPNLEFRGFVASPVSGTPQGLAVYQNGVRINEAFGDTVNWDLIPQFAVDRLTVQGNNPVFGLNALGGAVTIEMKNGFNFHGFDGQLGGGSFGNINGYAQEGAQFGNFAFYGGFGG